MRELIEVVIIHKEEVTVISIYITLTFCCTNSGAHYLCRAAKLTRGDPALFVHCCVPLNLIISIQKM